MNSQIRCLNIFVATTLIGLAICKPLELVHAQEVALCDVSESTLALLRIDLDQVDPSQLRDTATAAAPLLDATEEVITNGIEMVVPLLRSLKRSGVSQVFVRWDLDDWTQPIPVLAGLSIHFLCDAPEKVQPILDSWLGLIPNNLLKSKSMDRVVVLGLPTTLERLKPSTNFARPTIARAMSRYAKDEFALVVEIPEKRKSEFNFYLPEIWSGQLDLQLPLKRIADSLEYASLHGSLNTELNTTLSLGTATSADAEALLAIIESKRNLITPNLRASKKDQEVDVELNKQMFSQLAQSQLKDRESMCVRQMMIAMLNFEARHGILPPRELRSADGKPLLSWRVLILPFLDQEKLYREFHLDEPWDSPHNLSLVPKMPAVFALNSAIEAKKGRTSIMVPVMPRSLWFGDGQPLKLHEIEDGLSNTIGVVYAAPEKSVVWTKPEELVLEKNTLIEDFFGSADEVWIVLIDAAAIKLPRTIDANRLKAFLTHQGSETIKDEK